MEKVSYVVRPMRKEEKVSYVVRSMRKEDIPQCLASFREASPNIGMHSLHTWLKVDPEGFQIAVTKSGKVLGLCGAIIHHEDLAGIGMYTVLEKYRGRGIGFKIWSACMSHIGQRNACLTSYPEIMEAYRDKGGFPVCEEEWLCFFNESAGNVNVDALSDAIPKGVEIQPFQESHLPAVFHYDLNLVGYKRNLILEALCKQPDNYTFVAFKDGACVGFGTISINAKQAAVVGPLYADESSVAEALLKELLLAQTKAKGFVMFTINSNEPANKLITKVGCPLKMKCTRLYRKSKLKADLNKIFAPLNCSFSPF